MANSARLDKWLWAVRLFKTRALATAACRAGSVWVNGGEAKPAKDLKAGERLKIRVGLVERELEVLGIPERRVGAKLVELYCKDCTPPEVYEKAKVLRLQHLLEREKGSGRPTKRERRELDYFLGHFEA